MQVQINPVNKTSRIFLRKPNGFSDNDGFKNRLKKEIMGRFLKDSTVFIIKRKNPKSWVLSHRRESNS